jgi:hypothetical protein
MAKRKHHQVTYHDDGTFTLDMVAGDRTATMTAKWVSDDHTQRITDLFTYFGIDSALAGKPVQSDIDVVAARQAVR